MIEAVGHEHLAAYFGAIGALLRPGGKAVLQARCICHSRDPPVLITLMELQCCIHRERGSGSLGRTLVACMRMHQGGSDTWTPAHGQAISEPDERYAAYCASSDFIREHIFPGGHMPCMGAMIDAARGTGLSVQVGHIGKGDNRSRRDLLALHGACKSVVWLQRGC